HPLELDVVFCAISLHIRRISRLKHRLPRQANMTIEVANVHTPVRLETLPNGLWNESEYSAAIGNNRLPTALSALIAIKDDPKRPCHLVRVLIMQEYRLIGSVVGSDVDVGPNRRPRRG